MTKIGSTYRAVGLAAAGVLSLSMSLSAQEQKTAWAWVRPGSATTFTPPPNYQYNSTRGLISVRRVSDGRYEVKVPRLGSEFTGSVHASAYGGSHTAIVRGFGPVSNDLVATVEVYRPDGTLGTNEAFCFSYRYDGRPTERQAYLWANSESSPRYIPSVAYSWNGNRGNPTIARPRAGRYEVTIPGLAASGSERGNVLATPYGSTPGRVNIIGWGNVGADLKVTVETYDFAGTPADRKFLLSYSEKAASIPVGEGSGAQVWASEFQTAIYRPDAAWTDSNGTRGPADAETIERLGVGRYRVNLPNLAPFGSSNAQVTATGGSTYASVDRWFDDGCGGTSVFVSTYDASGARTDSRFLLRYLTNHPAAQIAWCRVDPRLTSVEEWTPSLAWQHSSAGEPITVRRNTAQPNEFYVHFPKMGSPWGCILATPYDGNHTAVVYALVPDGSGGVTAWIRLYTPTGAAAPNAAFNLLYRQRGGLHEREGWVHVDSPGVSIPIGWNGDRGQPTVNRVSPGDYIVTFPGLGAKGDENGHAQASAMGSGLRRAVVRSWTHRGDDVEVRVHCRDATGSLVDSRFCVHFNEVAAPIAPRFGSGAHLYADNPTAPSYVPAARTRDSNGDAGPKDREVIQRLAKGRYRVFLPDVHAGGSTVQVSPHGVNDDNATVASWNSGATGSVVEVHVFDEAGDPIDGRFTLLFLNNRAVAREADNAANGSGCHGLSLDGISRPIVCRDWHLELDGVPAGASAAFMLIDFANPNLSLGPLAPGCTLYSGGAIVENLSTAAPTLTIPVPNEPALVGGSVFVQGGVLVGGVNALGVALSNGLEGRIGDA